MKRSILVSALAVIAGTASAQQPPTFGHLDIRGSVSVLLSGNARFPDGLAGSAPFFLAGNTVDGFAAGRDGFIGFATTLTASAPRLANLGPAVEQSFNSFYDALLPLYVAIDGPLMKLAEPAAPLTEPLGAAIVNAAAQLSAALDASIVRFPPPSLPGLSGLPMR